METSFSDLDDDVLLYILMSANPKTVVSLCQTNSRYFRLCQDPLTFVKLMKKHYPHLPINRDPKKQFIEITQGKVTNYYAVFNNLHDQIERFTKKYIEDVPTLQIEGKLDPGTEVWGFCWLEREEMGITGNCFAYANKEEALGVGVSDYIRNAERAIDDEMDDAQVTREEAMQIRMVDTLDREILRQNMLRPTIDDELPHIFHRDFLNGIDYVIYYQVFPTILQ